MTRIVRIDVEYCILLTPARSAAAYAHQVHRKAMIVGLKSSAIIGPHEINTNEIIIVTVIASPKGAAISSLLGIAELVPSKARNLRVCFGFASQPLRSSQ